MPISRVTLQFIISTRLESERRNDSTYDRTVDIQINWPGHLGCFLSLLLRCLAIYPHYLSDLFCHHSPPLIDFVLITRAFFFSLKHIMQTRPTFISRPVFPPCSLFLEYSHLENSLGLLPYFLILFTQIFASSLCPTLTTLFNTEICPSSTFFIALSLILDELCP